jgi:outer membrane protein
MTRKFQMLAQILSVLALSGLALSSPASAETLSEALVAVYNKNPQLLAARARLREVDEDYIQTRAQGRFSVTASGQYSRSVLKGSGIGSGQSFGQGDIPDNIPPGSRPDNLFYFAPSAAQVEIVQPLYQGGRVRALKEQAKAGILAQRESLRATENQLFLAGANAYLDVQQAEEAARIRRNNVKVLTRQLDAANERFDVGVGTKTDIAQSDARLAGAEAGLAQAEAALQSARASYQRIVGRIPADLQPVPQFVTPQTIGEAIDLARKNNPELIAGYFSEEAGEAAIDVAKSAGRPTISLNGNVAAQRGQLFGFEQSEAAEITAQISIPIFSGGLNSSRVRQAEHVKTRLGFESRDRERAVDEAIRQIWAQREAARATLIASQKQVESAEVAFEGVSLELEVGNRTQLDVLDAEQELLNAKLSLIEAGRNLNASTFQLLSTIGVFDSEGIPLNLDAPYDPDQNFETVRNDGLTRLVDKVVPGSVQKAADDVSSAVESEVIKIENRFDGYADTDREDSGAQNPTVRDSPHN